MLRLSTFITVFALLSNPAFAAPGDLLFKLTSPDPQPGAGFGGTVAVAGRDIIVGESSRHINGIRFVGQAYVFDGQNGALKLTLEEPEPRDRSLFGQSLTAGNGSIFVGGTKRVYAFDERTGSLRGQIDGPNDFETFGSHVVYGNGQLLISEPSFSLLGLEGISIGQAYLYDAANGNLNLTIPNPEPSRQEIFSNGLSLALFGDKAAVGAMVDNNYAGRVWVFDRQTGQTLFRLENPNPAARFFDWFGWSVAANDSIIAVGAQEDGTDGHEGSGTVYLFDSNTGALKHTLFSPRSNLDGEFGRSLALTPDGDVLVGAWGTTTEGIEGVGRAFLFDGDTGGLLLDLANPDIDQYHGFGWSVAAGESGLVVGSLSGDVLVFEAIPEPRPLVLLTTVAIVSLAIRYISAANFFKAVPNATETPTGLSGW